MSDCEPTDGAEYTPSHEEIKAACAAIQATWTDAERMKRSSGCERREWRLPGARSVIGEPSEG